MWGGGGDGGAAVLAGQAGKGSAGQGRQGMQSARGAARACLSAAPPGGRAVPCRCRVTQLKSNENLAVLAERVSCRGLPCCGKPQRTLRCALWWAPSRQRSKAPSQRWTLVQLRARPRSPAPRPAVLQLCSLAGCTLTLSGTLPPLLLQYGTSSGAIMAVNPKITDATKLQ